MVKWGIIGCGGIAKRRMVPALPECKESQVVAVMDIDAAVTQEVARSIGARAYATEAELLADPEVQAVYVATPVYMHHQQVTQAAEAGKHALVEKPIALTVEQAQEMIDACHEAGVYLAEGYMMKFHSLNARARELVLSGELGPIVLARAQLTCWYPDIPGAWRQDPALGGGGSLIDMATHLYDLLQYIIGSRITSVSAQTATLTFGYPVEDSSTTLLTFENGAHGMVDAFFNIPDAAGQSRLEIYGNKGSILAEGTIGQAPSGKMTAYLSDDSKGYDPQQQKDSLEVDARDISAVPVNMYAAELDHMSRCIQSGTPPRVNTGEEGLQILRVALAAYESARTGMRVSV